MNPQPPEEIREEGEKQMPGAHESVDGGEERIGTLVSQEEAAVRSAVEEAQGAMTRAGGNEADAQAVKSANKALEKGFMETRGRFINRTGLIRAGVPEARFGFVESISDKSPEEREAALKMMEEADEDARGDMDAIRTYFSSPESLKEEPMQLESIGGRKFRPDEFISYVTPQGEVRTIYPSRAHTVPGEKYAVSVPYTVKGGGAERGGEMEFSGENSFLDVIEEQEKKYAEPEEFINPAWPAEPLGALRSLSEDQWMKNDSIPSSQMDVLDALLARVRAATPEEAVKIVREEDAAGRVSAGRATEVLSIISPLAPTASHEGPAAAKEGTAPYMAQATALYEDIVFAHENPAEKPKPYTYDEMMADLAFLSPDKREEIYEDMEARGLSHEDMLRVKDAVIKSRMPGYPEGYTPPKRKMPVSAPTAEEKKKWEPRGLKNPDAFYAKLDEALVLWEADPDAKAAHDLLGEIYMTPVENIIAKAEEYAAAGLITKSQYKAIRAAIAAGGGFEEEGISPITPSSESLPEIAPISEDPHARLRADLKAKGVVGPHQDIAVSISDMSADERSQAVAHAVSQNILSQDDAVKILSAFGEKSAGEAREETPESEELRDEDVPDFSSPERRSEQKKWLDSVVLYLKKNGVTAAYTAPAEGGSGEYNFLIEETPATTAVVDHALNILEYAGFSHELVGEEGGHKKWEARREAPAPVHTNETARPAEEAAGEEQEDAVPPPVAPAAPREPKKPEVATPAATPGSTLGDARDIAMRRAAREEVAPAETVEKNKSLEMAREKYAILSTEFARAHKGFSLNKDNRAAYTALIANAVKDPRLFFDPYSFTKDLNVIFGSGAMTVEDAKALMEMERAHALYTGEKKAHGHALLKQREEKLLKDKAEELKKEGKSDEEISQRLAEFGGSDDIKDALRKFSHKTLFNEIIIKEREALTALKLEKFPPNEKGFAMKLYTNWLSLPKSARVIITAIAFTGVAVGTGTISVGAAGGFALLRAGRTYAAMTGSQAVGKIFDAGWERLYEKKKFKAGEEGVREKFDLDALSSIEERYEEEYTKKAKRDRVRIGMKTLMMAATGAAIGLSATRVAHAAEIPAGKGGGLPDHGRGAGIHHADDHLGGPRPHGSAHPAQAGAASPDHAAGGGRGAPVSEQEPAGGKGPGLPDQEHSGAGAHPDQAPAGGKAGPAVPETAKPAVFEVKSGDSLWRISDRYLESRPGFKDLTPEQKTYAIDSIVKKIQATPDKFGLNAHDAENLKIGKSIDFSKAMDDKTLTDIMARAKGLTASQLENIKGNNARIAEWVKEHPGRRLDDEAMKEIFPKEASPVDHAGSPDGEGGVSETPDEMRAVKGVDTEPGRAPSHAGDAAPDEQTISKSAAAEEYNATPENEVVPSPHVLDLHRPVLSETGGTVRIGDAIVTDAGKIADALKEWISEPGGNLAHPVHIAEALRDVPPSPVESSYIENMGVPAESWGSLRQIPLWQIIARTADPEETGWNIPLSHDGTGITDALRISDSHVRLAHYMVKSLGPGGQGSMMETAADLFTKNPALTLGEFIAKTAGEFDQRFEASTY